LSAGERRIFVAVASAVLGTRVGDEAADAVAPFLRALPAADRRLLGLLLRMIEVAGPALAGRVGRFTSLETGAREAVLRRWAGSRLEPLRQGVAALKGLAALAHYGHDEDAWAEVGYRGPWLGRNEVPVLAAPDLRDPPPVERPPRPPAAPGLAPGVTPGRHGGADLRIRAQVCVVGTGAGGAAALAHLAERGIDAVAVEAGGYATAADFTQRETEMLPLLYQQAGLRSTADKAVAILQGRGVGGSTLHNTGLVYPTPAGILRRWRHEHGFAASDEEMAARLDAVVRALHAVPIPETRINANNAVLRRGAEALGWRYRVAMHNRAECSACGYCMLGCAYNRKYNAALTYLPRAVAAGARILADAPVARIEGAAGARRVVCVLRDGAGKPTGRRAVVEAPVVMVAAGALDTPALLLRSGLGNDRVGRGLRLHPAPLVSAVFPEPVVAWRGLPQAVLLEEFATFADVGRGGWLGVPSASNWPGLSAAVEPAIGAAHRDRMRELPHRAAAAVLLHDETEGRVTVSRDGRPVARYWPGTPDVAELRGGIGALARLYLAAGAERVYLPHADAPPVRHEGEIDAALARVTPRKHRFAISSVHPQGSCALGDSPRRSATNPRGEIHGAPGVYVADASLFPTSVGVPPQATVMALAGMVADGVADGLA
jgi:choline dehydrogenase-like flavoprotein